MLWMGVGWSGGSKSTRSPPGAPTRAVDRADRTHVRSLGNAGSLPIRFRDGMLEGQLEDLEDVAGRPVLVGSNNHASASTRPLQRLAGAQVKFKSTTCWAQSFGSTVSR